jgi:hypothetical protein
MVPPKKGGSTAPAAGGGGGKTMSLAELVAKNARLKKNQATAAATQAQKNYEGPEGDVLVIFKGVVAVPGDKPTVFIKFTVDGSVEGMQEFGGQSCDIGRQMYDTEKMTLEVSHEYLYQDIQRLGVETQGRSDVDIDADLHKLIGTRFTLNALKQTKGAYKGRYNYRIIAANTNLDVATPPQHESSGESDAGWEEPANTTASTSVNTGSEDEWADETASDALAAPEINLADYNPSDWKGHKLSYPGLGLCEVVDANDAKGMVRLKAADGTLKAVQFLECSPPTT